MNSIEIVYNLKLKGYSQSKLAKELHVDASHINKVINAAYKSTPVATRIAQIIKKPVEQIWPNKGYEQAA